MITMEISTKKICKDGRRHREVTGFFAYPQEELPKDYYTPNMENRYQPEGCWKADNRLKLLRLSAVEEKRDYSLLKDIFKNGLELGDLISEEAYAQLLLYLGRAANSLRHERQKLRVWQGFETRQIPATGFKLK